MRARRYLRVAVYASQSPLGLLGNCRFCKYSAMHSRGQHQPFVQIVIHPGSSRLHAKRALLTIGCPFDSKPCKLNYPARLYDTYISPHNATPEHNNAEAARVL